MRIEDIMAESLNIKENQIATFLFNIITDCSTLDKKNLTEFEKGKISAYKMVLNSLSISDDEIKQILKI